VFPKQAVRGGDIVIAYDGSLQAARTLASFAYSGLAQGRNTHILSFHDKPVIATSVAEQAAHFMKHHGLAVQIHAESVSSSIPEMLLDKTVQYSAGMLVMGAFGKNAVREFLFGSVTRNILHSLSIPVFLNQ
jgi:nucleotide-binding universal stress UspA family protein